MKAVVVNPEGTNVQLIENKELRPFETGKLCETLNTVVFAILTSTLRMVTLVRYQVAS